MTPLLTFGVNFASLALTFAAAWILRHYTMPAADPAAPAVPAAPAGVNISGVAGQALQFIEQQLLDDLKAHIGSIVKLPIPAPPAAK